MRLCAYSTTLADCLGNYNGRRRNFFLTKLMSNHILYYSDHPTHKTLTTQNNFYCVAFVFDCRCCLFSCFSRSNSL